MALTERIRSTNWLPQELTEPKQSLRQRTTGLSACSVKLFVGSTPSRSANAQSDGQSNRKPGLPHFDCLCSRFHGPYYATNRYSVNTYGFGADSAKATEPERRGLAAAAFPAAVRQTCPTCQEHWPNAVARSPFGIYNSLDRIPEEPASTQEVCR